MVSMGKGGEKCGGAVGKRQRIRGRTWCHCVCAITLSESRGLGEDSGGFCSTGQKHVDVGETNLCMKGRG